MALNLSRRTPLGVFPTPLRQDQQLSDVLGVSEIWVKRDDLTGFAFGGNKVRAAEFLAGNAVARGITDIVVSGGPSSNFAATMAAAGRRIGVAIHQVAHGSEPDVYPPALQAAAQCGAKILFTGSSDRATMEIVAERIAGKLCDDGKVAMAIPRGGATTVGANGFIAAAFELAEQLDRAQLRQATIVIPAGSGGSVAGLLAGRAILDAPWSIVGASVSRPLEESTVNILARASEAARALEPATDYSRAFRDFRLVDCRGEGFGVVSGEEAAFCQQVRDATGLLIDHTYNAKPLRWLAQHASALSGPIIYWLTGSTLGAFSDVVAAGNTQPAQPLDHPTDQRDNL